MDLIGANVIWKPENEYDLLWKNTCARCLIEEVGDNICLDLVSWNLVIWQVEFGLTIFVKTDSLLNI